MLCGLAQQIQECFPMIKRFVTSFILSTVVLLLAFGAVHQIAEEKAARKASDAPVAERVEEAKKKLGELDKGVSAFQTASDEAKLCLAFDRALRYEGLMLQYREEVMRDVSLLDAFTRRLTFSGRLAATVGYQRMKVMEDGEAFGCGGPILDQFHVVEKFCYWIQTYGSGSSDEKSDVAILRRVYLEAAKWEIEKLGFQLRLHSDDLNIRYRLNEIISEARSQRWHFSLDDLGVEEWLRRALGLSVAVRFMEGERC